MTAEHINGARWLLRWLWNTDWPEVVALVYPTASENYRDIKLKLWGKDPATWWAALDSDRAELVMAAAVRKYEVTTPSDEPKRPLHAGDPGFLESSESDFDDDPSVQKRGC